MSLVGSQTLTLTHYTTNVFKISLTGLVLLKYTQSAHCRIMFHV
jgi:hypothetical protein